jgi:hypothetical protein
MSDHWQKLGLLYCPSGANRHPKLLTHAANPLPIHIEADVFRIFFSGRDAHNRSSVGAVDIDIVKRQILQEHGKPFFEHGPEGSFFSDGVSIGNCYKANGRRYMLFMGWQIPQVGHWRGDIGRLIVTSELTLELESKAAFLCSDEVDPISLSYPWVLEGEDGGFSMWYGSTRSWSSSNDEMVHIINFAESTNGNQWSRKGIAVPFEIGIAQAFSRPTVVRNAQEDYQMWFSYRSGTGQKYRIGKAISEDGKTWKLALNDVGIDVSTDGWDSEMIEYPFVFDHKSERYMLYNGNDYGKTGFGLAILST